MGSASDEKSSKNGTDETTTATRLRSSVDPDVTIIVGDKTYHEYSQSLRCWSSYFDRALESGMKEQKTLQFEFPDRDPKQWEWIISLMAPMTKERISMETVSVAVDWFDFLCSDLGLKACDELLAEYVNCDKEMGEAGAAPAGGGFSFGGGGATTNFRFGSTPGPSLDSKASAPAPDSFGFSAPSAAAPTVFNFGASPTAFNFGASSAPAPSGDSKAPAPSFGGFGSVPAPAGDSKAPAPSFGGFSPEKLGRAMAHIGTTVKTNLPKTKAACFSVIRECLVDHAIYFIKPHLETITALIKDDVDCRDQLLGPLKTHLPSSMSEEQADLLIAGDMLHEIINLQLEHLKTKEEYASATKRLQLEHLKTKEEYASAIKRMMDVMSQKANLWDASRWLEADHFWGPRVRHSKSI